MSEKVLDLTIPKYEPLRTLLIEAYAMQRKLKDEELTTSHLLTALFALTPPLYSVFETTVGLDKVKLLLAHKNTMATFAFDTLEQDYDVASVSESGKVENIKLNSDLARGLFLIKARLDSITDVPFPLIAFPALASVSLASHRTLLSLMPHNVLNLMRKSMSEDPNKFYSNNNTRSNHPAGGGTTPPRRTAPMVESKFETTKAGNPLINFGTNLSQMAFEGKVEPIIGRSTEISRIERILRKKNKSNVIIIGEPGVGKTAIVEAVALKWVKEDTPDEVEKARQIWSVDINALTAGTRFRGDLEERVKNMLDFSIKHDLILFFDEIHMVLKTDPIDPNSSMVANALKPALARGLKIIGTTTIKEYRSIFEQDEAFSRRFQKVNLEEPTVDEAITIISKVISSYEKHHSITIASEAVESAVRMSKRYITDRQLPDKAFDLIDEASSKLREEKTENPTLTQKHIEELVSEIIGMPVYSELKAEDATKVNSNIEGHIIGQSEAVKVIHNSIKRHYAGLNDPNRPLSSFIFAGPTGVGKTELAKTLAKEILKDESAFISLDMSEFGQEHTISKLIGSPPGYVGSDKGGILTEQVNKKPYSVILFDEIEKAHPDIYNVLLQVLEEGKLTDGTGREVNFRNTIIILTTNVGATQLSAGPLGFSTGTEENQYEAMKAKVTTELKKNFRPELLNRFDDIVIFKQLSQDNVLTILDSFIDRLNTTLEKHNLVAQFTDPAKKHLAQVGYDKTLGARPLRRTLQDKVEVKLADWILNNSEGNPTTLIVDYTNEEITITDPADIINNKNQTPATKQT